MEEGKRPEAETNGTSEPDIRSVIRETLEEFVKREASKVEPAYKNELVEERKRREHLERRVNELINENARSRQVAEQAERNAAIRAELQRLGVAKVDLAFKAVKDDIRRSDDGRLIAHGERGAMDLREYLTEFVNENPEFLPARNLGGSGMTPNPRSAGPDRPVVDLDKIKPGMSAEDLEAVRREVARIASHSLSGR